MMMLLFRLAILSSQLPWKKAICFWYFSSEFDEMFDIPRLYTSAFSYAVQPVRLYPILMSILLYHYRQLTQCVSEVERIEARLSSKNKWREKEKKEVEQLARPEVLPQEQRYTQRLLKLSEF
jgi:hypothetical protein